MKSEEANSLRSNQSYITVLLSLALGWTIIYADRLSISPILSVIRSEFSLSYSEVGIIVSAYFIAYVVFTIPAMMLANRFGYKRVMVAFLSLAALSLGLAGGFGYTYSALIVLISVHGMSAGAYYPTSFKISTDLSPANKRGISSAIASSGMGFGTILGLLISGPVLARFGNWQMVLIILAIPTVVVAGILIWTVPAEENSPKRFIDYSSFRKLVHKKNFLLICSAMFCSLYGYWVILTWGPTYLQEKIGLGVFSSGLLTALFAMVAIPSALLIARRSDKFGRKKIALIILPLAGLGVLMIGLSPSLIVLVSSIIGYGIVGKLTLDPILVAWTGDLIDEDSRGAAMAFLNVFGMSSSILAPILTGALADLTGSLSYGFFFGGIVVFLGFVFISFAGEK